MVRSYIAQKGCEELFACIRNLAWGYFFGSYHDKCNLRIKQKNKFFRTAVKLLGRIYSLLPYSRTGMFVKEYAKTNLLTTGFRPILKKIPEQVLYGHMENFADRLMAAIKEKGNPCIVGLDPRFELIPKSFLPSESEDRTKNEIIEDTIFAFNECIIDAIKDLVPAIKLQSAFYEQYGVPGMWAFNRTIQYAKEAGLIVVADAKRNDIDSTAEGYANAFLGRATVMGEDMKVFDADALTVSPYMGRDSLMPFVEACKKYGKGLFILVKTSNPGSGDFQNLISAETNEPMYMRVAKMVDSFAKDTTGKCGYSSIGAVVGATYPGEAAVLRKAMPKAVILVPGYGRQGGTAEGTLPNFNDDKMGALIHAARSITFDHDDLNMSKEDYSEMVREKTKKMVADVTGALAAK